MATGPNHVGAWDITYLPAGVLGTFWDLYATLEVWSRKVVGWAVHEVQSDDLAVDLIDATCAREGVVRGQLALHADNGGEMEGKTSSSRSSNSAFCRRSARRTSATTTRSPSRCSAR